MVIIEQSLVVDGRQTRVTYYMAAGRRIILLTVFVKRQRRETAQIARAERAMIHCVNSHDHNDDEP